jgi:hypothetical protein
MSMTDTFNPETVTILQVAVDRALAHLPPSRQTIQTRNRLAEGVVQSASLGERNVARLAEYALAVLATDGLTRSYDRGAAAKQVAL